MFALDGFLPIICKTKHRNETHVKTIDLLIYKYPIEICSTTKDEKLSNFKHVIHNEC